jgi:hypothetical protein
VNRYWIQSLNEYTPEIPAAPPRNFKNLVKEIKFIDEIKELERENLELRRVLENAIIIIHYLDYKIAELKAEISLLKEKSD